MKTCLVAAPALLILATSPAISASDVVPAWQEPGFVMEEIVVTAIRPAWQRVDFVMEELVATATAEDVAGARAERQRRHPRIRLSQLGDAAPTE
jgi:hypothetical protein